MFDLSLTAAMDRLLQLADRADTWQIWMFAAVFLATIGITGLSGRRRSIAERIGDNALNRRRQQTKVSLRQDAENSGLDRSLKALEKYLGADATERSALRLRMIRAGYPRARAVSLYYAARVLIAVALPTSFIFAAPLLFPSVTSRTTLLIAVGLCVLGLYLPYRWVQSKMESRQTEIAHGFPDALDMLVVCVDSGLSLEAALLRVAEEIGVAHPLIGEEMKLVGLELRAGKTREQALTNFGVRTGVDDIMNVMAVIIQSDALGASLSDALTVQAEEMRVKRMSRAEEIAHVLPVKLAFPLIFCIMPALFAVVVGPAIILIARNIMPVLLH